MNKRQNRTHHPESLSLLSLKVVLTQARDQVPPRVQTAHRDANEEQALQLIRMMKLQFTEHAHPAHWKGSLAASGNLHKETVGTDAR